MATLRENMLFGMGNPLLDVLATTDDDVLTKYKLEANNAVMTDNTELCKDLANNYTVEYLPGGATQNTIKIAQWMLGGADNPNVTTYMGCVGDDELGRLMADKATSLGVSVRYQITKEKPTGTCACVITGKNNENRSLVANLAAAECFNADFVRQKENMDIIRQCQIYYISGFVLCVSVDAMLEVARHAAAENKVFCINLSAPFISQFFKEQLGAILPYVDILFGNEAEAEVFAKDYLGEDLGDNVEEIARRAAALPGKVNTKRPRLVVFSQGARPTIAVQEGKVTQYPVAPCSKDEIVDTTGAGDAFVGGFLAAMTRGHGLTECVRAGQWAAGVIIRRSGCSFPDKPDYVPDYFPAYSPHDM